MSWEMALASSLISSRVQISWVTAKVQESNALLGCQIAAIFHSGRKGADCLIRLIDVRGRPSLQPF